MGTVATMPQKKGRKTSASRLRPRKMIQKSFFSIVPNHFTHHPRWAGMHYSDYRHFAAPSVDLFCY